MTEQNHNQIAKNQPMNDLDRALDAALTKYTAVEPRAGLEGRILANLHAQPSIENRSRWRWTFAAAALALVIFALVLAWRSTRGSPQIAHEKTPTIQHRPEPKRQQADVGVSRPAAPVRIVRHQAPVRRTSAAVAAGVPKLDHFPSPQPLSDEELALAHYAAHFPMEARLVAHAQEEFARESQQQMRISGAEIQPSGLDEQER